MGRVCLGNWSLTGDVSVASSNANSITEARFPKENKSCSGCAPPFSWTIGPVENFPKSHHGFQLKLLSRSTSRDSARSSTQARIQESYGGFSMAMHRIRWLRYIRYRSGTESHDFNLFLRFAKYCLYPSSVLDARISSVVSITWKAFFKASLRKSQDVSVLPRLRDIERRLSDEGGLICGSRSIM